MAATAGVAVTRPRRIPRTLHPMSWWVWALGMAVAVSRTTNPVLLLLGLVVVGCVVAHSRTDAPWARATRYYLWLALVVVGIRVLFRVLLGGGVSPTDHILVTLPQIPLPDWAAGVRLGGPVSLESTLSAAVDGLRLGLLLCCVGAANILANPKRALRVLPGALYELGVAVVVCLSVAPQLVESVQRVRRARRLRAGARSGFRALRSIALPVLEDALERSLQLAAAMDSRGYGRNGTATPRTRRITAALLLLGMAGLSVGAYGLMDATAPQLIGLPAMLGGSALCCVGLALGGRRVSRSSYRPDSWRAAEWAVAASGVAAAAVLILAAAGDRAGFATSFDPLVWPALPTWGVVGMLLGATATVLAPPPPRPEASRPVVASAPVAVADDEVAAPELVA
jgi:energy-coupling factor transport system permease protein